MTPAPPSRDRSVALPACGVSEKHTPSSALAGRTSEPDGPGRLHASKLRSPSGAAHSRSLPAAPDSSVPQGDRLLPQRLLAQLSVAACASGRSWARTRRKARETMPRRLSARPIDAKPSPLARSRMSMMGRPQLASSRAVDLWTKSSRQLGSRARRLGLRLKHRRPISMSVSFASTAAKCVMPRCTNAEPLTYSMLIEPEPCA